MSAERLTLRELVSQRAGSLSEQEVWCLLSEGALALSQVMQTDPGSWLGGPSLLICPDTFLIGPEGVQFCQGAYSSEAEGLNLFTAPEALTYQGVSAEKLEVEKMYIFSLGECIRASTQTLQEEALLLKFSDDSLRELLVRMGERDPSRRDVTLQEVTDLFAAYRERAGVSVRIGALLAGGDDVTSSSVEKVVEFGFPGENSQSLARELDEADVTPAVPSSPPPRPPSAALQRVNSLDSLYRHIPIQDRPSDQPSRARLSGMYSRHISASFDDVSYTSLPEPVPAVGLETDTSLLLGVRGSAATERPMSTDSTGIPRILSSAKAYSGSSSSSSSSSEAVQEQLIESESSTLSETEWDRERQEDYSHRSDTLIKFTEQELHTEELHQDILPPLTTPETFNGTDESPPLTPTNQLTQDTSHFFSNGTHIDPIPPLIAPIDDTPIPAGENGQESPSTSSDLRERALPSPPSRLSQLSSSPSRSEDSPLLRGEDRGRARKSETDLLTLSQALEAGVSLPADGHSGTESGDELTPSAVRKKRGTRRMMSDQEVYVFEPTYDEEWQTLENREESMVKLRKLLGPDFQRLTGVHVPDRTPDASHIPVTSPIHAYRRDVEVILLNSRTFVANVEENSLVLDLFQQVVAFLSLQEPENFSLAIIDKKEEVFLDPELPLFKYSPRGWSEKQLDTHRHTRDRMRGRDRRFSVYFRVKFFVENVRLLKSRQTRHLYYLQLRRDLLAGRVSCEEEPALALAGLSLQIELGDYKPAFDGESYYLSEDYLHKRVLDSLPEETISDTLKKLHLSHQGLSRTEAELAYLKQAQKLPEYGIVYHKLMWQKKQSTEPVWAGISTRGFVLSHMGDSEKVPVLSFSWNLIKLMWHRNKKFVIQPQDTPTPSLASSELILFTDSYKESKYLLKLCQQFHTYQILTRMRVASGAYKGLFDTSSTLNLAEPITFYSSKGSLSTLHSGKSEPYLPPVDTETDLTPLPAGIDIPEEPGLKLMSVSLKQAPGFGFGLTVILNPPERSPGLYIQNIAINGPAQLDGKLKLFDQIMSVNGKPITGNTYKDVLSMLQTSQDIEMIVKTSCEVEESVFRMETPVIIKRMFGKPEEEFEVTLKRDTREDFGFTVEDTYNENEELCVAVREITNRDLAGMLVPGDRILEVNSVRLVSLKSAEINTLMEAFTDIHIRLQRDKSTEAVPEVSVPQRAQTTGPNYTDVTLNKPRKYSPKRGPPSPPPVPPATREKFMEPDYVEFETELVKINGSLGLNINILTRQSGLPVYVTRVVSGSSAERTGLIEPGDQIVSIDSNVLTDMGVEELVDFLAYLPDDQMLLFKLRREAQLPAELIEDLTEERVEQNETFQSNLISNLTVPPTEDTIELFERKLPDLLSSPKQSTLPLEQTLTVMILKDATGSLGIRLHSIKESDESTGIYIKEILKGSPASHAVELHAGAKIISINNQSLVGLDRQKAVSMLKKATNPILLDIIPDPLMVVSELSLTGPLRSGLTPPLKHVDTKSTLSHESLPGRSISTQELMAVLDSPDVREEHFTVELLRGERGLGLKVISKQVDQTGLLVKSILGDPAMSNGQLMRGDEITAIDDVNIQSMKRGDVLSLIKGDPGTSIVLHMKRYIRIESPTNRQSSVESDEREDTHRPEDLPASLLFTHLSTNSYSRPLPQHNRIEHVFELKLSRGSDQKLGIHIGSIPPDQFPSGIFVKKLTDNSVASSDGRLSVDDILLEANGIDLRNLTKEEALEALKQSTGDIKFLVARYTHYSGSSDEQGVRIDSSIELPPLPETPPPPIPLPSQHLGTPLLLDQNPSLSTNTDTIVLTQSLEPLDSMGPLSPDFLQPLLPSSDLYPNRDFPINPYEKHKGIQESTIRLAEPYTQLNFELYAIDELHAEIQRIKAEMEPESVENDFKEVRARKPEIAASVAKTDNNSKRNRSLRAIPYDMNRIVLNSTEPVDDYINASLVQMKVNDLEFKYVCTQAPLPSEVGRFWQMVWELELYVIIMLVELKEFGMRRTPPYWDESDNSELKPEDQMDFGNFSVMMIEENYKPKMTMRGIYLTNKATGENRHILQFNYKQWSGTGIPKSLPDLCNFIDYIRERVGAKEMLIHCSVGIGRTGSFCLVDILSKLVKSRVKADIFQLVLTLNSSRMNLIQTNEQYKVGYSALVHLLFERNP